MKNHKEKISYILGGVSISIYYFLTPSLYSLYLNNNKEKLSNLFIREVTKSENKYAGFDTKKGLKKFLTEEVFGFESDFKKTKISKSNILLAIKDSLLKCIRSVNLHKPINLYIFPSYNKFINDQMSGVSGYTPDSDNIILFISDRKGWEIALKNTVAHEYAHACAFANHKWISLLDSLIFEGIAENFRESILSGKSARWSKVLSKKQASIILMENIKNLNSSDEKKYLQLFLGYDNKYKLWSGYSIGYQIVKSFIRKNNKLQWPEIVKLEPKEILHKSEYLA